MIVSVKVNIAADLMVGRKAQTKFKITVHHDADRENPLELYGEAR